MRMGRRLCEAAEGTEGRGYTRPVPSRSVTFCLVLALGVTGCTTVAEEEEAEQVATGEDDGDELPHPDAPEAPLPEIDPREIPFSRFAIAGDVELEVADGEALLRPSEEAPELLELSVMARQGVGASPTTRIRFLGIPRDIEEATLTIVGPRQQPARGRLPTSVVTASRAVGTLRDFNTGVGGTVEARRVGDFLEGSFDLHGEEAPRPEPDPDDPDAPLLPPLVGPLVEDPGKIRIRGVFRALWPSDDRMASPSTSAP